MGSLGATFCLWFKCPDSGQALENRLSFRRLFWKRIILRATATWSRFIRNRARNQSASDRQAMKDRVLIVEDDVSMGDLLVDALNIDGFEVARVDNLARSFSEVLKSLPNIILADYQLRGGTAFDLLEWLRDRDLRIPVVVLTGCASIDLAVEAVKAGADQFIAKPVDLAYRTARGTPCRTTHGREIFVNCAMFSNERLFCPMTGPSNRLDLSW